MNYEFFQGAAPDISKTLLPLGSTFGECWRKLDFLTVFSRLNQYNNAEYAITMRARFYNDYWPFVLMAEKKEKIFGCISNFACEKNFSFPVGSATADIPGLVNAGGLDIIQGGTNACPLGICPVNYDTCPSCKLACQGCKATCAITCLSCLGNNKSDWLIDCQWGYHEQVITNPWLWVTGGGNAFELSLILRESSRRLEARLKNQRYLAGLQAGKTVRQMLGSKITEDNAVNLVYNTFLAIAQGEVIPAEKNIEEEKYCFYVTPNRLFSLSTEQGYNWKKMIKIIEQPWTSGFFQNFNTAVTYDLLQQDNNREYLLQVRLISLGGSDSGTQMVKGNKSGDVLVLQFNLNIAAEIEGVGLIKEDGWFGAKTLARVKKFQEARKLKTDGIVGKKTRNALLQFILKD